MSNRGPGNISMQGKGERLGKSRTDDHPYLSRTKLSEPTVCTGCGAVYHAGRWQWGDQPKNAHKDMCPACHRIHDKMPAGFLTLSGDFFKQHRNEIMHLVHHTVETQKAEHPLKRIMGIEEADNGGVVITFTDMHLPHGVGDAIQHAYKGEFEIGFPKGADVVRASWVRQE